MIFALHEVRLLLPCFLQLVKLCDTYLNCVRDVKFSLLLPFLLFHFFTLCDDCMCVWVLF